MAKWAALIRREADFSGRIDSCGFDHLKNRWCDGNISTVIAAPIFVLPSRA